MSKLLVQEEWVNATKGYRTGSSEIYETWCETVGELFKAMQKEYGRCKGKVYIGENTHIGWVFEKLEHYTDTNEPYLLETWVTVHNSPPVKVLEVDYMEL